MPYNFVADNFVADFFQAKCDFRWKTSILFLSPPFLAPLPVPPGGLRDNVRSSSLAHWKAHSELPISVNFFSLGVTAQALRANIF